MKKSFPANINGTIFYIDEDAYNLLNTYLEQIRHAFCGSDGDEIISDIEARISELFSERVQKGPAVITIKDVNDVIEKMGRPNQIAGNDDADQANPGAAQAGPTPPPFTMPTPPAPNKRLYRNVDNKVFGGVLSGLALYLNWNPTILRVLTVLLSVCFGTILSIFWLIVILYLIAWMIVPPAVTPLQKLEASGQPVTMNNLGQTVINNTAPESATDVFGKVLSIFGKLVIGFFGIIAGFGIIVTLWFLICCVSGIISAIFWNSTFWFDIFDFSGHGDPIIFGTFWGLTLLACIIPAIGIFWGACTVFFKAKGASRGLIITAIVVEVILIIGALVTFTYYSTHLAISAAVLSPALASFSTLQLC